jgi:cell division transport system permease protein
MRDILTSIRRTPYQSLAAFMVLFFTLFLSLVLFVALTFLYGLLGYVETRPQVTAYFQSKTPEADIIKIREDLIDSGKVLDVKYVSKAEAYNIYKQLNKDNPLLLEMVSADILPPSLEIYARKPSYLPEIASYLSKQTGVDEVNFQKQIVDRLLTLTTILRQATVVFFSFLIIMSIIVLTTTFLFKIAIKKDEIELLRLLGATSFYIKKPFLAEAILFGLTAVIAAYTIVICALFYLTPFLSSYLRGVPLLSISIAQYSLPVWPLNPIYLGITFGLASLFGMGIAFIASYIATDKYLT